MLKPVCWWHAYVGNTNTRIFSAHPTYMKFPCGEDTYVVAKHKQWRLEPVLRAQCRCL